MRRLDPIAVIPPLAALAAYGWLAHEAASAGGAIRTSTRALGTLFGWGEARVRRFLRSLQGDALIDAVSDAGGTLIRLRHQELAESTAEKATHQTTQETTQHGAAVPGSGSNGNKQKPGKRGSRLPEGWRPDSELVAFARSLGLSDERVCRETEQFCDYWHSAAGARATKLDWSAAYRFWTRKAVDDEGAGRDRLHRRRHDLAGAAAKAVEYRRATAERW